MPISVPSLSLSGSATSPWQFILANMDGSEIGNLTKVKSRKMDFWLNKPSTIEFTVPLSHPTALYLLDPVNGQELLIKAYKRGILKETFVTMSGQLAGAQSDTESAIAVTGISAGYRRISNRVFGKSTSGSTYSGDRTSAVAAMLAEINAASDSKIRIGVTTATSIVTAGPYRYQDFLSFLNDFGQTVTGYDHWITPTDPYIEPSGVFGYLNLSSLRGALRPNAIFEYGTSHPNAREYGYGWDAVNRLTHDISLPPDFPDNAGLVVIERPAAALAALETSIGRQEQVIDSSLVDAALRTTLLDEHILVRSYPRQVFTIQPEINDDTGRVPDAFFDYNVGDLVEGRVKDQGLTLLDGIIRCYGISVALEDASGVEVVTLTVVDTGA